MKDGRIPGQARQLECRIVLLFHRDGRVDLGMYDPANRRYEPLGTHGPSVREVDRVVGDLKRSIECAGHLLTFCELSK